MIEIGKKLPSASLFKLGEKGIDELAKLKTKYIKNEGNGISQDIALEGCLYHLKLKQM